MPMPSRFRALASFALLALGPAASATAPGAPAVSRERIRRAVDEAVVPLMRQHGIPGVAAGVVVGGAGHAFTYGLASARTRRPVTRNTLFELGSVTKTFTATLAALAQVDRRLALPDRVGRYLPELEGSPFGQVTLVHLGTHTPGGLPLQVPEGVHCESDVMKYFKAWRPAYPPGTQRTYANPGIGALGLAAARALGKDFDALMEMDLLPALGMTHTFLHVPVAGRADYAQGTTQAGSPARLTPGALSSETYGLKSTVSDMIRYLEIQMDPARLGARLRQAVAGTHVGYYRAGPMIQDLVWEQYACPVDLKTLLDGNAPSMIFDPAPVSAFTPPLPPQNESFINKTGSTNGFSAYLAFVPGRRLGVVLLANRSIPIEDRVRAAYRILAALSETGAGRGPFSTPASPAAPTRP